MRNSYRIMGTSVFAFVLVVGLTSYAFGQGAVGADSGSAASSAGTKGFLKLRATVICASCRLDEARATHPKLNDLYELSHGRDKVVIHVNAVNEGPGGGEKAAASSRWTSIGEPPQISIRAEDRLVATLMDQRNVAKEMEITGIIRNTRTLDISDITILG